MAKKDPVKPLFPLKAEFYASVDNFAHQAGMLADMCKQMIQMNAVDERLKPMLQERLDAFNAARFGGE
jgi:hypothetical protein